MKALLLIVALGIVSCRTGDCSNSPKLPSPTPTPGAQLYDDEVIDINKVPPTPTPSTKKAYEKDKILPTVRVYKPTGEKQCGMGNPIKLEDMKATIEARKVPVYDAVTQPDGKMHIAVCGAPSGQIHVFEIPKKYFSKIKALGFKEL